jgi:hypothetical protein
MTRLFRYCLFLALVTFVAVSQNTRDSLAAHWLYAGLAGSVASFSNVGSLDDWWTFANGCAPSADGGALTRRCAQDTGEHALQRGRPRRR